VTQPTTRSAARNGTLIRNVTMLTTPGTLSLQRMSIDATLLTLALGGTHSVGMTELGALLAPHLGATVDDMGKVSTVDTLASSGSVRRRLSGRHAVAGR
jgi:hypothetical protein